MNFVIIAARASKFCGGAKTTFIPSDTVLLHRRYVANYDRYTARICFYNYAAKRFVRRI